MSARSGDTAAPRRHAMLGLRARASLSFGLGALFVASTMAVLTFALARSYLLGQREDGAVRQSYVNARLVRDALGDPDTDVPELLTGLRPDGRTDVAVLAGETWYSTSVAIARDVVPEGLRRLVDDGGAGRQKIELDDEPTLVTGVALPAANAAYFEVFPMIELRSTLDALRVALAVSAVAAAVAGALVGLLTSRRTLAPLRQVASVASDIAGGSLDRRLEVARDQDLTPLTDAFNDMVDALQERIRREARFSSDVSHEMRSPLAALSAAMAVATRRRDAVPPEVGQVLDVIGEQIAAFERLTLDLLEISRVDSGSVVLDVERLDLATFAERFTETLDEPRPRTVVVESGFVLADRRRLRQVLDNLVSNAARYGGGADQISVRRSAPGWLRISVDDRGDGVPPAERERIFDRFARGRAAVVHPEVQGSGLGLALAREHVELQGGRLRIEDRPGGGASFVVELPEADADAESIPEPSSAHEVAG